MWSILKVIGLILFSIFLLAILIHKRRISNRKKEISDWKIGDLVTFYNKVWVTSEVGVMSATLVGWDLEYVFIQVNNLVASVEFNRIKSNKSAIWRRHYNSCETVMGTKPSFTPFVNPKGITNAKNKTGSSYNGKAIESLNETECEIYLKECLANEDYETATLIRKQLEKLR